MTLTQLRAVWSAAALLSLLSAAAVFLNGCGRSDADLTRDVASRFLQAMDRRDWEAARPLLTSQAQERMEGTNPFTNGSSDSASPSPDAQSAPEMGDPKIDGDTAVVPATLKHGDEPMHVSVRLRREQKEWRVYAVHLEGGPTGGITLDFEHPEAILTDAFRMMGAGIGAMMKGVGEGLGAMMKGIGEGVAAMDKAASPYPAPPASPDVQIEEKR